MYFDNSFDISNGYSNTRIYGIWKQMKNRCNNPNTVSRKYYYDKNISVCEEWSGKYGFINFYIWSMLNGYDDDLSIDRIDSDGNYEPNNCRWVEWEKQVLNRKNSNSDKLKLPNKITYLGKTMSIYKWAKEKNITYNALRNRLLKGWSIENALETPLMTQFDRKGKNKQK